MATVAITRDEKIKQAIAEALGHLALEPLVQVEYRSRSAVAKDGARLPVPMPIRRLRMPSCGGKSPCYGKGYLLQMYRVQSLVHLSITRPRLCLTGEYAKRNQPQKEQREKVQ